GFASFCAESRIEAEGKRRRDRHALYAIRGSPSEGISLHVRQRLLVDSRLDSVKLVARQHRLARRKAHLDEVLERNPPLRGVVVTDSHTQRIERVNDDSELRMIKGSSRQRQQCADAEDETKNCVDHATASAAAALIKPGKRGILTQ